MHVSTLFLLVLLGWLALRRWRPRWRWLQRCLLLPVAALGLLVYPFTNNLLARWLEYEADHGRPCLSTPPVVIVVLPAGLRQQPSGTGPWSRLSPISVVRIMEGLSLAKRYPGAWLVFAGDKWEAESFERGLEALGAIGPDRLVIDRQSSSTDGAARQVAGLLGDGGRDSAWLVTSALHMRRAKLAFEQNGVKVCPYPVDYTTQSGPRPWWIFPPPQALDRADRLAHEILGLAWYWVTGKI